MKNRQNRQKGFIVSAELMLIATILVLGMIVGLGAVRVAVVTELADVGAAIASVNQGYSYDGIAGHHAATNGSSYFDLPDTCDDGDAQSGPNARCVTVCAGVTDPIAEGAGNQTYNLP